MKELLKNITEVYKKNHLDDLNGVVNEKKLLFLYALYHYYYGDDDSILDVKERCHFTQEFSNFAQGFFEESIYDEKIIDVLIPYYVDKDNGEAFDIGQIRFRLTQTQSMVSQIKNKVISSSQSMILRDYWNPDGNEKLILKVITNYKPDYDEKNKYRDLIQKLTPMYEEIRFEIVFGDEIEEEISQLTSDKKNVEYGELTIDKENNYLSYGEEGSVIVNISALSLKENFNKYGKAGLFAQNLRFYVADKKVDVGIEHTIREKGQNFWYYNNGIIIVCDDYRINGKTLSLQNYSIVNGGQTTRMIGNIPFSNDFMISCKVIRNKYKNNLEENAKFVSEIAEASNTQKPINSTDLIANRYEQRYLKQRLSENGIFMQIKRGDLALANVKENYPEVWQKTKSDELGQIIYATICQKPGTARSSKDSIFSDKKKYASVFGNPNYDLDMLKDLLFIRSHYKKWASEVSKDDDADEVKKGLVKNGFYFFAATIMLIAKFAYSKDLTDSLKSIGINSKKGSYIISQRTFNHRIFNDEYDALKKRMYELFELICDKYIVREYKKLKDIKTDLVYSNFTKTDKNYITSIATSVYDDFAYAINPRVLGAISPLFYQETEADKLETKDMVEDAIDSFDAQPIEDDEVTDLIAVELKEKLKEFRTKEFKARGLKAYDIFTNKELDALVLLRPKTVGEILQFSCFKNHPRLKAKQYGQQIVNIINDVCGEKK